MSSNNMPLASQVHAGVSRRTDFNLIPSKTALLVIDIQDHLSSPSHTNDSSEIHQYLFSKSLPNALTNIVKLVDNFRSVRDNEINSENESNKNNSCHCEVVFTYLEGLTPNNRDISLDYKLSGESLSTRLPNTDKKATFHNIPKSLQPNPTLGKGDILIPKTSCSVFVSTNIHYILRNLNIEQLVICGQLTDQCVMSAVRDAADLGYFVTVVQDACAAQSGSDHERGILGMQGFSRIVDTKQVIEELHYQIETEDDIIHVASIPEAIPSKQTKMVPANKFLTLSSIKSWQTSQSTNYGMNETLLHMLQYANVKFLRYATIDASNSMRTKVIPIQRLIKSRDIHGQYKLHDQTSIAKVCIAGLPSYADAMVPGSNLTAEHVLILQPDMSSLRILPYTSSSAMVFGTLHQRGVEQTTNDENILGDVSEYCPRSLLQRVLQTAEDKLGIGFGIGAEIEFILVRDLHNRNGENICDILDPVDSTVFASSTTLNDQDEFIDDLFENLTKQNLEIETIHSESAPGQLEVVLSYQTNPVKLADSIVMTRETIKQCAKKYGLTALFLPKVFDNAAGNGMHLHMSIFSAENDENIFPSRETNNLMSGIGEYFLEGILSHMKGLMGLTMPSVNSFRRVGKGCWTGHSVSWMVEDKECPLRVCLDLSTSKATNVEFKLVSSACNPYLAIAGILYAGMNGIHQKLKLRPMMSHLGESIGHDKHSTLPLSLEECLGHLSNDDLFHELLGENLLKNYLAVKEAEVHYSQQRTLVHEVKDALSK